PTRRRTSAWSTSVGTACSAPSHGADRRHPGRGAGLLRGDADAVGRPLSAAPAAEPPAPIPSRRPPCALSGFPALLQRALPLRQRPARQPGAAGALGGRP